MSNELVAQQLAQQLSLLEQLATLLNEEKGILQQQNPEALLTITETKNNLLVTIETLDKEITSSTDFHREKQQGLHQETLTQCKDMLEQCQQQNVINGQIIQQSQLAVERMKTSLLENHNKSAVTYDSKGKKSAGLSSLGIKA